MIFRFLFLFYRQGNVQFNLQRKRMMMMMENQGCQTDVEDEHVLAYPRSTQTEELPKEEEKNSLLRLVERISLSPEPAKRPNSIFACIRTPTYFTTAISNSLMIGTTSSGNQEGERKILERRLPPPPPAPRVVL